ncbi:hypothetical protein AVEN_134863-1 [Araneus ventricosus]|uniref:Uncharacterized protein n=1 Tax=Araneus ventricosus TaxID=182803 RepID=A0A4Y2K0A9_ARAVE|nr:hypothetical protein AVEN_134863-1 [Araneus ventricosus]
MNKRVAALSESVLRCLFHYSVQDKPCGPCGVKSYHEIETRKATLRCQSECKNRGRFINTRLVVGRIKKSQNGSNIFLLSLWYSSSFIIHGKNGDCSSKMSSFLEDKNLINCRFHYTGLKERGN